MPDAPADQAAARQDQYDPHRDIARWTRRVGVFTACLVVVSAIADWFIYQQFLVANRQYKVAAHVQADTREQLRAVVQAPAVVALVAGTPPTYQIVLDFHNYGGTRTATFIAWSSMHYFDGGVPNSQDFSKPWQKVDSSSVIIGTSGDTQISPGFLIEAERIKITDKAGIAVVWGHADWADIFQPNVIHPINFCISVNPVLADNGKMALQAFPLRPDCNNAQ